MLVVMLSKKLNDSFEMPIDIKVNQLEEDEAQINIGKLVDKETVKKNPFEIFLKNITVP